ncbi:MAG: hypothetical protein HY801_11620 [Candidatus Lindowbacteria bacterium]|nr:hypothetical protein [Candidatus Lindowbacteria bacterium]
MPLVRLILKGITGLIYFLFASVVLYFPFASLLEHIARETRLLQFQSSIAIEDVLLPGMVLALLYWLVAFVRRKIEPPEAAQEGAQS